MLGKLIKHEFLDTYKLLCVYYVALAALTVLSAISINSLNNSLNKPNNYSFIFAIFSAVVSIAYTLILSLLGLITILALCSHFNKTMYGDRGYLTHILPVSKGSILAAKYIVSIVWCIISMLLIILSIMVFCSFESGVNLFVTSWEEFIGIPWEYLDAYLENAFGIKLIPFIGLFLLMILVTILHIFSFVWACISIGQLANEKRTLLGVTSGIFLLFAEYFIKRWIRTILKLSMYGDMLEALIAPGSNHPVGNLSVITSGIIISLAFFAVETFATWYISSKKLNLA